VTWSRQILLRAFGRPRGVLGRLGGIIMARMNRPYAADVVHLLEVRSDDKILEVGFGPGVGIQLLLQRVPDSRVAGVDPSREMIAQAVARNAHAVRSGRADLRCGSAEHLPFADQTFDKAMAINSMHVWPDAGAGLGELRRVLKPGGRLVLGFTFASGQAKAGVAETLTTAGFADAHIVERPKLFCAIARKP
jgi:ubiquinone/menaquinone biosynthesis C-methylase UbiE